MYKKPYHHETVLIVGFGWSQLRATGGSIVGHKRSLKPTCKVDVGHIGFIYILLQYSIVSIKAVQFVECSNEFLAVRHLDVALLSVPHHICSIKNSFDLRCQSVTLRYVPLCVGSSKAPPVP